LGDPWEHESQPNVKYPLLLADLNSSQTTETENVFEFQFYVCDRVLSDEDNELHVLSDMRQLANDLVAYFGGSTFVQDLRIDVDVNLEAFTGRFDTDVAGWQFPVKFRVYFDWDLCGVPVTGQPSQTNSLLVTIKDQNGNTVTTLNPGSTYTIEVLEQLVQTLSTAPATIIQTLT
jgi:hypothetical protein